MGGPVRGWGVRDAAAAPSSGHARLAGGCRAGRLLPADRSAPGLAGAGGGALPAPDIENGRLLFAAGGCASCHATPGQDDRTRLGGGLALASPFGTFHPPNISPHTRDGIGNWGVQDFVDAMASGVGRQGEHLYPAFPYTSYRLMPPRALADLFAYIRTLPPVEGRAPAHELRFPFNIRRVVGGWKLLFFEGASFRPDPAKSEGWNRGAYLVNGPGHCAECHSSRNALGAVLPATRFAGGPDPEGKGWVPNITQDETDGLGKWSQEQIAELLKTGLTPSSDSVGGPMAEVVRNMAQLPDADRAAMAEYLKSLPAVASPPQPKG